MLHKMKEYFQHHPVDCHQDDDWARNQAAVLIALTRDPVEPTVVLTKRSEQLNSHRGQVAFPGGKRDREDPNLLATALREAHEEISLPADQVEVIGRWRSQQTRFNMDVTPFVGLVDAGLDFQANEGELDAVFEVPLSYFIDQNNLTSDHFSGPGYSLEMPCYIYEGFRIWGFTLGVLVDLLNQSLHAGIDLQRPDFSVAERLPQRGRLQAAR